MIQTDEEMLEDDTDYNIIDETIFFKKDLVEEANKRFEDAKLTLGQLMAKKFLDIKKKHDKEREEKIARGEYVKPIQEVAKVRESVKACDNVWSKTPSKPLFKSNADAKGFISNFKDGKAVLEKKNEALQLEKDLKKQKAVEKQTGNVKAETQKPELLL